MLVVHVMEDEKDSEAISTGTYYFSRIRMFITFKLVGTWYTDSQFFERNTLVSVVITSVSCRLGSTEETGRIP